LYMKGLVLSVLTPEGDFFLARCDRGMGEEGEEGEEGTVDDEWVKCLREVRPVCKPKLYRSRNSLAIRTHTRKPGQCAKPQAINTNILTQY